MPSNRFLICVPVEESQIRSIPSAEPDTTSVPSGLDATEVTQSSCPHRGSMSCVPLKACSNNPRSLPLRPLPIQCLLRLTTLFLTPSNACNHSSTRPSRRIKRIGAEFGNIPQPSRWDPKRQLRMVVWKYAAATGGIECAVKRECGRGGDHPAIAVVSTRETSCAKGC